MPATATEKKEIKFPTIIAIDPGYDRFGIAVLKKEQNGKSTLLFSDCMQTNSKDEFIMRLHEVVSYLKKQITTFKPDFLAIETLFFSTNQKTALRVAEVRGAVLYVAKESGLKIMEIHPLQIKQAVTGDGKSDKSQMIKMVTLLTGLKKKAKDDEYDAIAVGLSFLALYRPGYSQLI